MRRLPKIFRFTLFARRIVFIDPVKDLAQAGYIAILLSDIKEVSQMGALGSIADTLLGDDAVISVLHRVDTRRADAPAGRAARHYQGIDAHTMKRGIQMCAKKSRRILLYD